jgi:lipid A disaccharide synthetase
MGFAEIKKPFFHFRFYKTCKQDIADYKPDALIFIDILVSTLELLNGQNQQDSKPLLHQSTGLGF